MMKFCLMTLLIEDVLAFGGVKNKTHALASILAGPPLTKKPTTKEVIPAPEAIPAPTDTAAGDNMVSCGGHDTATCSACTSGAPDGPEGASWCNGDCVTSFSGDSPTCSAKGTGGFVSCGHHQAADCSSCANTDIPHFCNGSCEWNESTSTCGEP